MVSSPRRFSQGRAPHRYRPPESCSPVQVRPAAQLPAKNKKRRKMFSTFFPAAPARRAGNSVSAAPEGKPPVCGKTHFLRTPDVEEVRSQGAEGRGQRQGYRKRRPCTPGRTATASLSAAAPSPAKSGGQGALLPRNLTVAFPGNRQWNDRYAGSAAKSRRRQGIPRRRQATCLCKQVKFSRDVCRRPNRRKYPGMCARRRRAARRCFHPAALYSLNAQSTGRAAMTACALVRSP